MRNDFRGLVFFVALIILAADVFAGSLVYDDFSSGVLNLSKWNEEQTYEHWPFLAEHYVNTAEQRYHQAQPTVAGDRETLLILKREFNPGESLDYDVYYNLGEGNVLGRVFVNFEFGDRTLHSSPCEGLGFATGGAIGYWNGVSCVG